eukprot:6663712-Pyramimonas_sp.AAC.1
MGGRGRSLACRGKMNDRTILLDLRSIKHERGVRGSHPPPVRSSFFAVRVPETPAIARWRRLAAHPSPPQGTTRGGYAPSLRIQPCPDPPERRLIESLRMRARPRPSRSRNPLDMTACSTSVGNFFPPRAASTISSSRYPPSSAGSGSVFTTA